MLMSDVCVIVCVAVPDDAIRVDCTLVPLTVIARTRLPVVPEAKTPYEFTMYKPIRRTVTSPVVVFKLNIASFVFVDAEYAATSYDVPAVVSVAVPPVIVA